ncbi:MAG: tripartite tricarboxylate transporter substrate binding protein [Alphaproteobacteria bacterium]|nr:tripartite tricarboxylate transporter substrate binding protein [Alphaproteobacteria bacterium]
MRHALAVLAMLVAAASAAAQPYPTRPIRMIVGFPAGGPTDLLARMVGEAMSERLGQPVVVDNRPGAGGIIGDDIVAKAAPDGYTLGMMSSAHTTNPSMYASVPHDVAKDFSSIALVALTPYILVVNPSMPARSLAELVAWIKAQPGEVPYASNAIGGRPHLAAALLARTAGLRLVHVPYKGAAPTIAALLSGEIPLMFENTSVLGPHIKAGKMRPLAITTRARLAGYPELPTIAEQGYPGFEVVGWFGVRGPARLPQERIAQLNGVIAAAIATPALRARLAELGAEPGSGSADDFERFLAADIAHWGKVIRDAGIKAE